MTVRPEFREALQVSPERIANLNETDMTTLIRHLFEAHAYRCRAAVSELRINTEEKAGDGGCDGWTPQPPAPDAWFGARETCWQFKTGTAGQRHKLKGEITKRVPAETLRQGGRVVVVASEVLRTASSSSTAFRASEARPLAHSWDHAPTRWPPGGGRRLGCRGSTLACTSRSTMLRSIS
jgi:hypothetical protein